MPAANVPFTSKYHHIEKPEMSMYVYVCMYVCMYAYMYISIYVFKYSL